MFKSTKTLVVAGLSAVLALGSIGPSLAMPMPGLSVEGKSDVTNVDAPGNWQDRYHPNSNRRSHHDGSRGWNRDGGRDWRGDHNRDRHWDDRRYRDSYRYGNRRYYDRSDALVPLGALAAGALIGGALSQPSYRGGSHEEYCASRYRTYRAYDNTYQPTNGPRRQCR